MGIFLSKIWKNIFKRNRFFKILILGLANAVFAKRNLGKVIQTSPTIGNNVQEITANNVKLQVWDIGGQENIRSIWSSYFEQTDVILNVKGIIFVIDSSQKETLKLARVELFRLIVNQKLKKAGLLIMCNKQDLKQAMSEQQIIEQYNLTDIKNRDWKLQLCSAKEGRGLIQGVEWLADYMIKFN